MNDLIPDYTVQQYKDGVAYFQEEVAGPAGLTTVFDPLMYTGSNGVQALEEMASKGDLSVRWRAALALTPADDLAKLADGRQGGAGRAPPARCSRRRP